MKILSAGIAAVGFVAAGGMALAQDAAKGEKGFAVCKACHSLESNMVGPALNGVVGREAGTAADYSYSPLMKAAGEAGLVWNEAELTDYLKNPTQYLQAYVKGKGKDASGPSKMPFNVANETKRKDVVAYLKTAK